jgi:hypothetical protein
VSGQARRRNRGGAESAEEREEKRGGIRRRERRSGGREAPRGVPLTLPLISLPLSSLRVLRASAVSLKAGAPPHERRGSVHD